MRFRDSERSIRERFPAIAFAIVTVLVLGLLGGLLHHHESESDEISCCYCHVGLQTPVSDLASALVVATFAPVGFVTPGWPSRIPRVIHFSTLVPRAPPVTTLPGLS
jgi:hypothetical protein